MKCLTLGCSSTEQGLQKLSFPVAPGPLQPGRLGLRSGSGQAGGRPGPWAEEGEAGRAPAGDGPEGESGEEEAWGGHSGGRGALFTAQLSSCRRANLGIPTVLASNPGSALPEPVTELL